jgi:hypothetical protein
MQPAAGRLSFSMLQVRIHRNHTMLKHPQQKYRAFSPTDLPNSRWPSARLTKAPIWLSTDLRDGRQALIEPMDTAGKLRMFEMLVKIGSMVGADRVEGCPFGNGKRTGITDLVSVAFDRYAQGIEPGFDFFDVDDVGLCVEQWAADLRKPFQHEYAQPTLA